MEDTIPEPTKKLFTFLDSHNIKYTTYFHKDARTSEEANKVRPGFSIQEGVKALILQKKDGTHVQIVVPGDRQFNTKKVRKICNTPSITFCSEETLHTLTNIVPGGVHPFGMVFNIPVCADISIFENERIIFSCGDRGISACMHAKDYKTILQKHKSIIDDITSID